MTKPLSSQIQSYAARIATKITPAEMAAFQEDVNTGIEQLEPKDQLRQALEMYKDKWASLSGTNPGGDEPVAKKKKTPPSIEKRSEDDPAETRKQDRSVKKAPANRKMSGAGKAAAAKAKRDALNAKRKTGKATAEFKTANKPRAAAAKSPTTDGIKALFASTGKLDQKNTVKNVLIAHRKKPMTFASIETYLREHGVSETELPQKKVRTALGNLVRDNSFTCVERVGRGEFQFTGKA